MCPAEQEEALLLMEAAEEESLAAAEALVLAVAWALAEGLDLALMRLGLMT